jgi:hypothetical protein
MSDSVRTEEFRLDGDKVVGKVKEIIEQGNVRRIIIKSEDGKPLLEVPMTVGMIGVGLGVVFAPVLAAIGALAAIVARVTVVVERVETPPPPAPPG